MRAALETPVRQPAAGAAAALGAVYARLRARGCGAPATADGQLIRPLLALAGADALGSPLTDGLWSAAAAVQLAHEASLLHDDVIDGARERRSRPTLAAERGVAAALVEGDHLLTTSYRVAAETGSPAFMAAFARAVERTVAGERMQGRLAGTVLGEAAYRRLVAGKSGELLGCALAAAPLLSGSPRALRWYALGRRIGLLYQMLDDLLDYLPAADTGKPPFADFRQRRWTWPLLFLDDVSFDDDVTDVARRFAQPSVSCDSPLRRCHARLEREADLLRAALAALLPDDVVAGALIDAWLQRAADAVARTERAAQDDALRADLEARVPQARDLDTFFRHNSRSFSFAARLFPAQFRHRVTGVYAFCRVTDDIADDDGDATPGQRLARLDLWERLAARAYASDATGIALLDSVMRDAAAAGVPFDCVRELIEGMRMDVRGTEFATMAELRVYSHRVAGVVGQWLTVLCGRNDPWLLERAASLGHAMQLTNILRDVGEDLRMGRVYLPEEVLQLHGFRRSDLPVLARMSVRPPAWDRMMEDLMARADRDYAAALQAAPWLPPFFRRAVVVAAHVYRGIHDAIRRNGYDNFGRRARTGTVERLRLAVHALAGRAPVHAPPPARAVSSDTGRRRPAPSRAALPLAVIVAAAAAASPASGQPLPSSANAATVSPAGHLARIDAALAAAPHDPVLRLDRVRALFFAAVDDRSAVRRGHDAVRALREEHGSFADHHAHLLLAYEGAFHALDARHGFWPHHRLRDVRDGLDRLDRAVAAAPDHAEVRYLRLVSTFYLPSFFGRRDSSRADLRALAALLRHGPPAAPGPILRVMADFVVAHDAGAGS